MWAIVQGSDSNETAGDECASCRVILSAACGGVHFCIILRRVHVLKRTSDVLLSLIFLFSVLPILAIAAILIKMDSPGPVFFNQLRMGRGFKPFRLFKLRTMEMERPGSAITLGHDPRITRVGGWLRKLKIDELPQLWNVLRGEMSFVGSRPVIVELAEEFRSSYERLLVVRPGLTDPATLLYANEAEILARVAQPMHYFRTVLTPHKLQLSENYLRKANLGSDFILIAKTGKRLIVFGSQSVRNSLKHRMLRRLHAEPLQLGIHYKADSLSAAVAFSHRESSVLS
jgi:lipopolysaccharide/colanic/teichoic acid biosynthesis glycosyltransferase